MKTIKLVAVLFIMLSVFASCDKDDTDFSEGKALENTELKTVLKAMGYEFDADNKLIVNDKAIQTKSLDLSGKKLTSFTGLEIFPHLTEVNLANNMFEDPDFSKLPVTIIKLNLSNNHLQELDFIKLPLAVNELDLQGNKLYEFKTLKPERKFAKLYLPETAKYNTDEVLAYYTANKMLDIQIRTGGKLIKYTSLRSVPDPLLRAGLKQKFPSVFTGDKIDLSKEMAVLEGEKGLLLLNGDLPYNKDVKSLEGIQYIANFKNFSGNVKVHMKASLGTSIGYFKVSKEVSVLQFVNVNFTEAIDWKSAKKLISFGLGNATGLQEVDLSFSEAFGKIASPFGVEIALLDCPDLEKVVFPSRDKQNFAGFMFQNLPNLKELDLSKIGSLESGLHNSLLGLPSCWIKYPTALNSTGDGEKILLYIDKGVGEKSETKSFTEKSKNILSSEIYKKSVNSSQKPAVGNATFTGDYLGVSKPIINDKKYKDVASTFKLSQSQTGTNKMNIYLPPFKTDKMPGKLKIDIKNTEFTTAYNGNISFVGSQPKCVTFKLTSWPFITYSAKGDYKGTIINKKFYFFIHAEKKTSFLDVIAEVTFNGTKQ